MKTLPYSFTLWCHPRRPGYAWADGLHPQSGYYMITAACYEVVAFFSVGRHSGTMSVVGFASPHYTLSRKSS